MTHQDVAPLSDDERAELEHLRAEKAAREEAQRAQAEREELRRLREQKAAEEDRERARSIMEPGDDLSMPLGQKIVLLGVLLCVIVALVVLFFGQK